MGPGETYIGNANGPSRLGRWGCHGVWELVEAGERVTTDAGELNGASRDRRQGC